MYLLQVGIVAIFDLRMAFLRHLVVVKTGIGGPEYEVVPHMANNGVSRRGLVEIKQYLKPGLVVSSFLEWRQNIASIAPALSYGGNGREM